tara:strand:- start:721 stop:1959 length:1239 start_codon:yes stop_codon:yes gene_type:complete
MKGLIKDIIWDIREIVFKTQFSIHAYYAHIKHKVKGGNFQNRFSKKLSINKLRESILSNQEKRVAILVAFHKKNKIPVSNKEYIKFLTNCSFNVIYLHNGKLEEKVILDLESIGCYVICRQNIGQDFGAWKDMILLLEKYNLFNNIEWLLLCNDSNFFLGGKNGEHFERRFLNELENNHYKDFISLNINYELMVHHQSYFLCLSKKIINSDRFRIFWQTYLPLNLRPHAINKGEKKLSSKVLNKYTPCVMFTTYDVYKEIVDTMKDTSDQNRFLQLLPKTCFYLDSCINKDILDPHGVQKIIHVLENYNQSHSLALLLSIYCKSPFLKKDVIRHGTYSLSQIEYFICNNSLIKNELLINEIKLHCRTSETPFSFWDIPKEAARKGISRFGQTYNLWSNSQVYMRKFISKENN